MKVNYIFGSIAAALVLATSCVDKDADITFIPNPDVDFTYAVQGDEYKYDFYVVSTIQFTNTSSASGSFTWDFGDGTTSTEVNPVHKFEKAGVYEVKLTHDTKGTKTYPLMIYDIVPVLSVAETSTEVVEFNNTLVSFALELPNPENLRVRYDWTFPEGTTNEAGEPMTTFTGYSDEQGNIEYPGNVKFANIGSQRVDLRTYFDVDGENRRLEDAYLNVQVGCSEPAATLYYATRGGNIKAYKLVDDVPAGTKVYPFDLGVPSGATVFNLCYADVPTTVDEGVVEDQGWVYILDAGKQYYYINDEDGVLGDGKITAMRTDGSGVNTVITNVGGAAFLDPFIGYVYNGNLYYTDRNTGVSTVGLTERGLVQEKKSSTERATYFVQNNVIPYYNRGISYGAISNGLYRDKAGWWWWGKKYNGKGIFRFRDTDIYSTQADAEAVALPAPVILNGIEASTFAIDEARQALYVWRRIPNPGLVVYNLPGVSDGLTTEATPEKHIAMDADPVNTTEAEGLYTTQLAIDGDNGRVYFAYRPNNGDSSGVKAGINYYDPADQQVHKYGEDADLGTGIVINPNKTKLF
ncbi:MAG: PKD domain-containing protein [Muribaculaceae bacterium]|nr:PKD domain-containing protein [Muribaculaceae bacterium]